MKQINYNIVCKNGTQEVTGYSIDNVHGLQLAARKQGKYWTTDEVSTGCRCHFSSFPYSSRKEAIDYTLEVLNEHPEQVERVKKAIEAYKARAKAEAKQSEEQPKQEQPEVKQEHNTKEGNTMKTKNSYTSTITGKTYTLPGFYEKSRNGNKVCSSETATLLYTYITESGRGGQKYFTRYTVYSRPRGGLFESTHHIGNARSGWTSFYDCNEEEAAKMKDSSVKFASDWAKMFKVVFPEPENKHTNRGRKITKHVIDKLGLAGALRWYDQLAIDKSIKRHARKVNRAEIIAAAKAVKATAAGYKKHTLPAQVKLELPAQEHKPEVKPVQVVEVKPVAVVEAVTTSTNKEQLTGKGWRVMFDTEAQRTRVIFDNKPSREVIEAVKEAGFYWSPKMQSWNKHLTNKARKAAAVLADKLAALAA